MAKLPTPTRCRRLRRLCLRLCDAMENTHLLRQVLEYRQRPFLPPGVPSLEDEPAWDESLDRKTPAQEEEEEEEETKNPNPDSEQNHPSEDSTFGVIYGPFEFSVAAATRLLDFDRGQLVVRNPDRMSLLHDGSERSVASGDDGPQDLLVVYDTDLDENPSEEQLDMFKTPLPSQEPASPASPTSPLCQPLDLGEGRGYEPPYEPCDVYPDEHIFFWPPRDCSDRYSTRPCPAYTGFYSTAIITTAAVTIVTCPLYRTSLSQNPRRRGVIFPFI